MKKQLTVVEKLRIIKNNNSGTITFHFEDGSKQRQSINKELFIDERGKELSLDKVAIKINEISHDLRAKYYIIN